MLIPTDEAEKSAVLYYRDGTSDKVYSLALKPKDGGWVVDFSYGRRGDTMKPGTKTKTGPVDYPKAWKIYSALMKEKVGEGYTTNPDGQTRVTLEAALSGNAGAPQFTAVPGALAVDEKIPYHGYRLIMLQDATLEEVQDWIADDRWELEEKKDGIRLLALREQGAVSGVNKNAYYRPVPVEVERVLRDLPADCVLDGELIGTIYHVYDLLKVGREELVERSRRERYDKLNDFLGLLGPRASIRVVPAIWGTREKAQAFTRLREARAEGVVFKRGDKPYLGGKSRVYRRYKFIKDADLVVSRVPGPGEKQSIGLSLYAPEGGTVEAGDCTVPVNQAVPPRGSVVTVRYLYARKSGKLAQPRLIGVRNDKDPLDCTTAQLVYKQGEGQDDEEEG